MSKRTVRGFVLAATLVLVGLVASGRAAGADTLAPPNCEPGYACIVNGSGHVVYKNAGNANNLNYTPDGGGYVWNNGVRYPGLDHIQLYTTIGTSRYTICLHYGREPVFAQPEPTAGILVSGETVTSWRWRGECIGDEDTWHRI
jgi:hypothetical protein